MQRENHMFFSTTRKSFICLLLLSLLISGCASSADILPPENPDLTIFTSQEKSVYEPIIKEYQERTGYKVHVESGTFQDLQHAIDENTLADRYDVVFGIHSADLDYYLEQWQAYESPEIFRLLPNSAPSHQLWVGFCSLHAVIVYNTKVVTYREEPVGWMSLLEPSWKGRIAFLNPEISDIYATALVCASQSAMDSNGFLSSFADNLFSPLPNSLEAVNQAVADGQYSLGITLDTLAEQMKSEGEEIYYVYPEEGDYSQLYGSALISGCHHPEPAKEFLDFTIGKDVQNLLSDRLNRHPVRKDIHSPLSVADAYPDSSGFIPLRETTINTWRILMKNKEEGR